jgi:sugar-phosphatase
VHVLLFDMDGVLVDSVEAYRLAWTRWAAFYEVETAAIASDVHGRRPEEVMQRVLADVAPDQALGTFDRLLDAAASTVGPMPGAQDLTGQLPEGRWAIVTSGRRRHVIPMLERAGITPPAVVICGDETVRGKPDPECFLRAAEVLNAKPEECTVVEDAPAGINAALAAGMAPIAVATTHAPEQLVGAKRVFPSLLAASSYLLSLAEDRGE